MELISETTYYKALRNFGITENRIFRISECRKGQVQCSPAFFQAGYNKGNGLIVYNLKIVFIITLQIFIYWEFVTNKPFV